VRLKRLNQGLETEKVDSAGGSNGMAQKIFSFGGTAGTVCREKILSEATAWPEAR
jgi:hypothetical protein